MLEWFADNSFFIDVTLVSTLLVMSIYVVFQAGVFSLASVGYMAVGAYVTGILTTKSGMPIGVAVVASAAFATAVATIVGLIVARLSGIYLALATFAFSQAIIVVIQGLGITNGTHGIVGIPTITTLWWAVTLLVVVGILFQVVHRSYFGRAFRSVRLDDVVARGMGIPTTRYKLVAMAASGTLAGTAGALNALQLGVISPDGYNFQILVLALTYVIVGGVAHWFGPMLAALTLGLFHELLRGIGTDVETAAYGVLLILLMIVAPQGLGDPRLRRVFRIRRRRPPDVSSLTADPTATTSGAER